MRRLTILALVIFGAGLIIWYVNFRSDKNCRRLKCISFAGIENFRIKETYENGELVYRALWQDGNALLRVEVHSGVTAVLFGENIGTEIAQIKSIYDKARSPYPGEISDEIVCDRKYVPDMRRDTVNGIDVNFFSAFLSDRLTYGACTADTAVNKVFGVFLYCPATRRQISLEWITRVEESPQIDDLTRLKSIHCG